MNDAKCKLYAVWLVAWHGFAQLSFGMNNFTYMGDFQIGFNLYTYGTYGGLLS